MDEDAMGKGFDKSKLRTSFIVLFLFIILIPASQLQAAPREFELFDKAYEYYLSYQPEKAVETFRTFLAEFPRSSSADAALFWLGRCYVQLKLFKDANKYFSEVKSRFPDSPLVPYAEREADLLAKADVEKDPGAGIVAREEIADARKLAEAPEPAAKVEAPKAPELVKQQELAPPRAEEKKEEKPAAEVKKEEVTKKEEQSAAASPAPKEETSVAAVPVEAPKPAAKIDVPKAPELVKLQEPVPPRVEEKKEEKPAAEVKKEEVTKTEPVSSGKTSIVKTYTVQAGVFRNEKAANRVRKKLHQKGYSVAVKKTSSADGARFNVLVGEFRNIREAQDLAVKIRKEMDVFAFPLEVGGSKVEKAETSAGKEQTKSAKVNGGAVPGASEERKKIDAGKEPAAVVINGKRYTVQGINEYVKASSAALVKTDIRAIPWRGGSPVENFINEEILYAEAKRSGIEADPERMTDLSRRYKIGPGESAHVERYLAIQTLFDRRDIALFEERPVESLSVKYAGNGDQEKVALASKLQEEARNGASFEDISRLHPGEVVFSVIKVRDLPAWLRDSLRGLKTGEVSVVWKRGGYMLLKPRAVGETAGISAVKPGGEITARTNLKEWIEKIKKDRGIKIVYE